MAGAGTANAVVMCKIPISNHSENGFVASVSVLVDYTELNDEYHFYVCCSDYDDPASGTKITYTVTSLDPLTVETSIPGGGTDGTAEQQCDPYGVGQWRMQVCADHMTGQIKAGVVSAADEQAWANVDPGSGLYIGIGHNNTSHQNRFDDFNMEELRTVNEVCADCWCWCLRRVPFRHMTATITNTSGSKATCLSGYTWDMDWVYESAIESWVGQISLPQYDGSTVLTTWTLKCDSYDDDNPDHPGHNWMLSSEDTGCQFSNTTVRANDDSECDPEIVLKFGPFTMANSELSCLLCEAPMSGDGGSFYVEITE